MTADTRERGWIGLRLRSEPGVAVTIAEGPTVLASTTPDAAETTLRRVTTWRCDRRVRILTATSAGGATTSVRVRTPSCARRLALKTFRRLRAGQPAGFVVGDRWKLGGLTAESASSLPGGLQRCQQEPLGKLERQVAWRPLRPGTWRLSATTRWGRTERAVRVTPADGRLDVLATGDSMIQIVDGYLKERLGRRGVRVRSDAHISTGISKPSLLDWQKQARRHAARRPDVVVMFLGANDGFPMGDAPCCANDAWIAEYARRAARMMRTYGRGGRTRILWLLLPTPRRGFFTETFPAVNAGIRRAAERARRDARVVDLVEVFTPGGRYRDSMRIGDRVVRVRQPDGVHLNGAGASHAANVIIGVLREERILAGRSRPRA